MIVDHLGRNVSPALDAKLEKLTANLHPLDDEKVWREAPAYQAPTDVNLAAAQSAIDSVWGVTRNNESLYRIVWSGDRDYWFEWFMSWHIDGKPDAPATKRPRIRYKSLRDDFGKLIRDVFPPRWLILKRIEVEQIAHDWKERAWFYDPSIGTYKQLYPETLPKPYWQNHITVASHTDYCCATRRKNSQLCFGKYAHPLHALKTLEDEKAALEASGQKVNPFEKIDAATVEFFNTTDNNYRVEVEQLQIEMQVYLEHPFALIDPRQAFALNIDSLDKARNFVREYYKQKIDDTAEKGKI